MIPNLFVACSHNRRSAHGWIQYGPEEEDRMWCPGGRPATLEDLGGEIVIVTETVRTWAKGSPVTPGTYALIPLPQMVAGESL